MLQLLITYVIAERLAARSRSSIRLSSVAVTSLVRQVRKAVHAAGHDSKTLARLELQIPLRVPMDLKPVNSLYYRFQRANQPSSGGYFNQGKT
jgi:hypothetical protein